MIIKIFALLLYFSLFGEAFANATITITYTFVEDEVYPQKITHRSFRTIRYFLKKDGSVSIYNDVNGKYISMGSLIFEKPKNSRGLGGSNYVTRIRIFNGKIIHATFYSTYKVIDQIITNGIDKCNFEKDFILNRGSSVFIEHRLNNAEEMRCSALRAEDATCSIVDTGD